MLVKRFGNDVEGVCQIERKRGGGHAFNWSIKNGVTKFFDGQLGSDDTFVSKECWKNINPNGSLIIARLDSAEIVPDVVKKWLE